MYWVVYRKRPPSLLVIEITFALLCCIVHDVPNSQEEKRNAGDDKDGNEQHYSSLFKSIKTSKLLSRPVVGKIKYIYVYRI